MKLTTYIAVILIAAAVPAVARITKTRPSVASSTSSDVQPSAWAPLAYLMVGAGVDYQEEVDLTEIAFPLLLEYRVTERLGFVIEAEYATIEPKSQADFNPISGFGDLETAIDYEIISERRYRPALSLEGGVRWPTAADPELGERGRDYSFGIIASKDLVHVELDFNLLYTFIGDPEEDDEIEASLAGAWHLNPEIDLIAEIASVSNLSVFRAIDLEATLGIGWNVNNHLQLEQGIVFKEDGEWAVVFACEWNFGGD